MDQKKGVTSTTQVPVWDPSKTLWSNGPKKAVTLTIMGVPERDSEAKPCGAMDQKKGVPSTIMQVPVWDSKQNPVEQRTKKGSDINTTAIKCARPKVKSCGAMDQRRE